MVLIVGFRFALELLVPPRELYSLRMLGDGDEPPGPHSRRRIALGATGIAPAAAERLVTSLSTHQVMISSNFTGTELVLFRFGRARRRDGAAPRRLRHRGDGHRSARRHGHAAKGPVLRDLDQCGILYTFDRAPGLSRRAEQPAARRHRRSPDLARRLEVGLRNVPLSQTTRHPAGSLQRRIDPSAHAARLLSQEELAVTFLTPNLFRASIAIPAESELGNYEVDVKLFADGTNIARTASALEIVKVGIEQFVVSAARDHALLYGLATVLMALMTGWLASVVFRRD
jgi:hypothetical protein